MMAWERLAGQVFEWVREQSANNRQVSRASVIRKVR